MVMQWHRVNCVAETDFVEVFHVLSTFIEYVHDNNTPSPS